MYYKSCTYVLQDLGWSGMKIRKFKTLFQPILRKLDASQRLPNCSAFLPSSSIPISGRFLGVGVFILNKGACPCRSDRFCGTTASLFEGKKKYLFKCCEPKAGATGTWFLATLFARSLGKLTRLLGF